MPINDSQKYNVHFLKENFTKKLDRKFTLTWKIQGC